MSLERRSVVSVLLFPCDVLTSTPARVLLFRRSDKVRTYQGQLAPIAGSIEATDASPLHAAWRELREETGLGPRDLELWRRGPGFEFTDETAVSGAGGAGERKGRIWRVWPFAFRFKGEIAAGPHEADKPRVTIDWEHTGYEWRTVEEILDRRIVRECVPRLEVTLGQVWVGPGTVLHQRLEQLRLDHAHGARQLATMAVESMIDLVPDEPSQPHEAWWGDFRLQAYHLAVNGRPSMAAAISKAVVTALSKTAEVTERGPGFPRRVKEVLENYVRQRSDVSRRVGTHLSRVLKEMSGANDGEQHRILKILTLSSSSTIMGALLYAFEADESLRLEVRVLESRPLFEGVAFAAALSKQVSHGREERSGAARLQSRLRIVVATDASVGILSKDVDLVVIGADRISEAGDVSNKTGSLSAVLTSKYVTQGKCRVVCVSETDKIAPPGPPTEHAEEDNDHSEVTESWDADTQEWLRDEFSLNNLTVQNVYFEWVPAPLVDHYICEDGVLSTEEIARKSQQGAALFDRVFSDAQAFRIDPTKD